MNEMIYAEGRHYDRLFGSGSGDLPFWSELARTHKGPILELGCGTGRLTIALSKQGFDITGIDNSEAMLTEAKRKGDDEHNTPCWIYADMREFRLNQLFSLIFVPANALCHLLSLADFESFARSVKGHLRANGRLAIDVFVPDLRILNSEPEQRTLFSRYDDPDGRGLVEVMATNIYEAHTQINRIKTFHRVAEQELVGTLDMRMYYPQELDALLKYNGFSVESKFKDYDFSTFDASSQKQLLVCSIGL